MKTDKDRAAEIVERIAELTRADLYVAIGHPGPSYEVSIENERAFVMALSRGESIGLALDRALDAYRSRKDEPERAQEAGADLAPSRPTLEERKRIVLAAQNLAGVVAAVRDNKGSPDDADPIDAALNQVIWAVRCLKKEIHRAPL